MKRRLCFLFVLLGLFGTAFAQETKDTKRFIILPLANQVDTNRFYSSDAENAGLVTFLSIYDFIRNLPFADVPDRTVLQQIPNANPNLEAIAKEQNADFILYGNYQFKGNKSNPTATLSVKVWSADVKRDIFSKDYNTPTDIDLLDTIDQIIKDAITGVFNIETKMASVTFGNFKINPKDRYRLLVNNKEVARVTNQNFSYSLKVLANTPYHFKLINESNETVVMDTPLSLKPKERTNLSYSGSATVEIKRVKGKAWGKHYQVLFDGQEVAEKTILSNLPVNVDHRVVLLEDKTNTLETLQLSLLDGENRVPSLGKERGKTLYYRAYGLGYLDSGGVVPVTGVGLGIDVFFGNSLWAGLNVEGAFVPHPVFYNVYFVSTLDLSYYFVGDKTSPFRVGAGILGEGIYNMGSSYPIYLAGLSLNVEWKFLYLKMSILFHDLSAKNPLVNPSFGVKF